MKIKLIVFMIMLFIVAPILVEGMDSLGVFTQDKCVELIQTCENCTYVNISSLIYPNSSQTLKNVLMTKQDTLYNYSFCNTNLLGDYTVNTFGNENGKKTTASYGFIITQTGTELSTANAVVYFVFLFILFALWVFSLFGALKIPWYHTKTSDGFININDLKWLKLTLWVFNYLILMFIVGLTRSLTANYLFLTGTANVFNWIYWIMLSLIFPIIVVSFILIIISAVENKKLKDWVRRGFTLPR